MLCLLNRQVTKIDGGKGRLVGKLANAGYSQERFTAAVKVANNEIGAGFFKVPNGVSAGRNTDGLKSRFAAGNDVSRRISNDKGVAGIDCGAGVSPSVLSRTPDKFSPVFSV